LEEDGEDDGDAREDGALANTAFCKRDIFD